MTDVVTRKDEWDDDIVQWVWRKKAYSKSGRGVQEKMGNPNYYVLETSQQNVLLAWRAPLEIDDFGQITFGDGVMPCSEEDVERLDRSFRSRNRWMYVTEEFEKKKAAERDQWEKK